MGRSSSWPERDAFLCWLTDARPAGAGVGDTTAVQRGSCIAGLYRDGYDIDDPAAHEAIITDRGVAPQVRMYRKMSLTYYRRWRGMPPFPDGREQRRKLRPPQTAVEAGVGVDVASDPTSPGVPQAAIDAATPAAATSAVAIPAPAMPAAAAPPPPEPVTGPRPMPEAVFEAVVLLSTVLLLGARGLAELTWASVQPTKDGLYVQAGDKRMGPLGPKARQHIAFLYGHAGGVQMGPPATVPLFVYGGAGSSPIPLEELKRAVREANRRLANDPLAAVGTHVYNPDPELPPTAPSADDTGG